MKIEAGLHDYADFAPVEPGRYEFTIKQPPEIIPNVEQKSDIGGRVYNIVIRPEIMRGDNAGKTVRRQFTNRSKGARYFLRSFLEKVGVDVTKDGAFNSEDLLGRRFEADVNERTYTDGEGNERKTSDLDTESVVAL